MMRTYHPDMTIRWCEQELGTLMKSIDSGTPLSEALRDKFYGYLKEICDTIREAESRWPGGINPEMVDIYEEYGRDWTDLDILLLRADDVLNRGEQ